MGFGGGTISTSESRVLSLQISQSSQGLAIPLVWGTTRLPGNLLWYDDFTAISHTSTQSSGGKGGAPKQQSTTYTYTAAFVLGLCSGPITGVRKIWKDKDVTNAGALGLEVHTGALGQGAWAYLTTKHPDQALGYSGIAYVANGAFDLGSSSSPPNLAFEVQGRRAQDGIDDVEPADVLLDVATDPIIGVGMQAGQLADLADYRVYCAAMGFRLSPTLDAQTSAAQFVTDLMTATHSEAVWSEAKLKIIPYGDQPVGAWAPEVTPVYDLSEDHFLGLDQPIKVTRKRVSDAYNSVKIEYLDRTNDYNVAVAEASDLAAIDRFGPRPMSPQTLHAICRQTVAETVASAILQRETNLRNTFEFQLDARFGRLEPMDLVTLTHARLGMNRMPVRIVEIRTNEEGDVTVTAEEWPFGVAAPARIPSQGGYGYIPDLNVSAGNANTPVIFEPPISLAGTPQLWLGTAGGENWGGAEVWVSLDGNTYSHVGEISAPARHGLTVADFPLGGDPDNAHTLSVDFSASAIAGPLMPATAAERDLYQSLLYVGGELVAYQGASLVAPNRYELTNLRRGGYGSKISAHPIGSPVLRCDDAVFKYSYDPALVGQTIWLKLRSFNRVHAGIQDLASLTPIAYTVVGAPLGSVVGLKLTAPWTGRTLAFEWQPYRGAVSYTVELWHNGVLRRTASGLANTEYSTTIGQLKQDGIGRHVEIRVYAVSQTGVSSEPAVMLANKPQIDAPTVWDMDVGGQAMVMVTASTDESYLGTRMWFGAPGFDPDTTMPMYDGPGTQAAGPMVTAGDYAVRAAQYDEFGPDELNISSEVGIHLASLATGVPRVPDASTIVGEPGDALPPGGDAYIAVYSNATDSLWTWDPTSGRYLNNADLSNASYNLLTANRAAFATLSALSANLGNITSGNITLDSAGFIRGGASSYAQGKGIYFGYSGADYVFRAGSVPGAGTGLCWDGARLTIYGATGAKLLTADDTLTLWKADGTVLLSSGSGFSWNAIGGVPENLAALVGTESINNNAVGYGTNLIANSDLAAAMVPWFSAWNQDGWPFVTVTRDYPSTDWTPAGGHALCLFRAGVATGVQDVQNGSNIAVVGGQRYEVSGYVANQRARCDIAVLWLKLVNGVETQAAEDHTPGSTVRMSGGQSLTNWERLYAFVTAPADAQFARVFLRQYATGESDPYSWLTRCFFGSAAPNQTQPSPWSPAGVTSAAQLGAVGNDNRISSANISTYMESAAISRAFIGNAAIGSAQIGDAEVSTLKIQGEAVTVPRGVYAAGPVNFVAAQNARADFLSYVMPVSTTVIVVATGTVGNPTTGGGGTIGAGCLQICVNGAEVAIKPWWTRASGASWNYPLVWVGWVNAGQTISLSGTLTDSAAVLGLSLSEFAIAILGAQR
ncbi:MAG: phage tail protein [Betaproteobacteria bacterium]|nr:phage tail protein [Betaproteobacteria bacterium]